MGDYGLATRVLAGALRLGVDLRRARSRDVGQLTRADAARTSTASARSAESTDVYGVVGGAGRALGSPAMHNAAFRGRRHRRGLPAAAGGRRRRLRDVRAARSASAARASRFRSRCRCSIASTRSIAVARRIGAINTIRVDDGRWIGGNTDVDGFLAAARRTACRSTGVRAAMLGAGGAARAVAVALASSGCAVTRARAQSRSRPQRSRRWSPVEVGAVAAGAGQLGSAGQLHAGRHVSARRRDAAAAGAADRAATSTTSSTTRR